MTLAARTVALDEILDLRDDYRDAMRCQIIHESIHARPGWTVEYLITDDDTRVGYGSVAVGGPWREQPVLYEFFVRGDHRHQTFACFEQLLQAAAVTAVETQTNDALLTTMLLTYGRNVRSESVLFADGAATSLAPAGVLVRAATPDDGPDLAAAALDTKAPWVAIVDGMVVGAGGVLYHYNRPYGDIYMAVAEAYRRRGIGAFLVQELRRACHAAGSLPAARCGTTNLASRRTLQKAGFVPCGAMIAGTLPSDCGPAQRA